MKRGRTLAEEGLDEGELGGLEGGHGDPPDDDAWCVMKDTQEVKFLPYLYGRKLFPGRRGLEGGHGDPPDDDAWPERRRGTVTIMMKIMSMMDMIIMNGYNEYNDGDDDRDDDDDDDDDRGVRPLRARCSRRWRQNNNNSNC